LRDKYFEIIPSAIQDLHSELSWYPSRLGYKWPLPGFNLIVLDLFSGEKALFGKIPASGPLYVLLE
jgi:hypothetical protein